MEFELGVPKLELSRVQGPHTLYMCIQYQQGTRRHVLEQKVEPKARPSVPKDGDVFPWYTLSPQNPRASEVHHTVLNARLVEEHC